jgi:hypothetical protein
LIATISYLDSAQPPSPAKSRFQKPGPITVLRSRFPGGTVGTATFGQITNTRWPTGDSGLLRQLQLAMKLVF